MKSEVHNSILFQWLFPLLMLVPSIAGAASCNSNGNGNWTQSGTWTCGTVPDNGDEIVIAANTTVTITNNLNYTGAAMHVKVYGTWRFHGGGSKISMPCGSTVQILQGGRVVGNTSGNSQTIGICNTTYWSVSQGQVDGPRNWPDSPLAVDLISFEGSSSGLSVMLAWATASEQDSDLFQLLRSQDASHWDVVASVAAAGQSTSLRQYKVEDDVPSAGNWYYRLVELDMHGDEHEKGAISLHVAPDRKELVCGPMPATDGWMDVHLKGMRHMAVEMISAKGQVTSPRIISAGGDQLRLDLSSTPRGIHVLAVTDVHGERGSCRLIIP